MLVLVVAACSSGCTGLTSAGAKAESLVQLILSNIGTSSLSATAATITWATNVGGSSQVLYGTTSSYGQSTTLNSTMVTSHSASLSSLTASTLYHYQVVSTDASGNVAKSSDLTFTTPAASTPPTVSVTSPAAGATVSGSAVTVSANASASAGLTLTSVQFLVDGSNLGSPILAAPWTTSWNTTGVSNGTHSLTAQATDNAGNKTTSAPVSVTVNNTTPPTISITSPASGATVSGTVTITTTVSANTTSVQFQVDGNNTGSAVTTAPFSYSLNTTTLSNATHSITAVASNAAAQTTTSAAVSVTVNNPVPPTISITSPASGATVFGTVTITTSVSANTTSVQFKVDGNNVGAAVTSAPFSYSLNTTTLSNATHSITAVASNAAAQTTTSAAVSVTVNNTVSTTPPTISITAPASGATVSGTLIITTSVSANTTSVQFQVDGNNTGAAVTTTPFSYSLNTTTLSNAAHSLTAVASNAAAQTTTSAAVTITVSNSAPPPPPNASDTITITNTSNAVQTNQPVSISRPFVQGEIADFAQASINGVTLLTQCDVKNRWPDASLKFAVVSFIVPSIPAGGSVTVSFSNQTSGNNTGFLSQGDILSSNSGYNFNFDGQIQLTGTVSHNISALSILTAASSCNDPGSDPDAGAYECSYWLKGPIVTAVILEDRAGRSFDVNTDGASGNPLHPRFEAWFFPSSNQVQLGYTLEDDWASTTAADSARDQTYSLVLTAGNSRPTTEYSQTSFTQLTRTMWHKMYCTNGTGAGAQNGCENGVLHIDHNWPYLASTKFWPNWDPALTVQPTKIASEYSGLFGTPALLNIMGCTSCYDGFGGVGDFQALLDNDGAFEWHGPLTTWDIIYLLTQCDAANSTAATCGNGSSGDMYSVMLQNADLGGSIPYWYREADVNAGHGQYFDAPNDTVPTQGRVVSINARTQETLWDTTSSGSYNQCNTNYAADWIAFGGSGQDLGFWNNAEGNVLDLTHWPNIAYTSYLMTGEYAYYEQQVMQSAYAVGAVSGSRACDTPTQGSSRVGADGYWGIDQERGTDWQARENALGAFVAVDGSPEKVYLLDKLNVNLSAWEGEHGIALDVSGCVTQVTCSQAWSFGNTYRTGGYSQQGTTPLYSWTQGVGCPGGGYIPNGNYNTTGSNAPSCLNSNFMNAYSSLVIGEINDLGFCPQTNGACQIQQFGANWFIDVVNDPNAGMYVLGDYTYPTLNASDASITGWSQFAAQYAPGFWPRTNWGGESSLCGDEGYGAEGVAALSYAVSSGLTSNESYTAASAYATARPSLLAACTSGSVQFNGNGGTPKWDIVPRVSTNTGSLPTVSITSPAPGATVSGTIAVTATASASSGNTIASVQFVIDGSNLGSAVTTAPYSQSLDTSNLTNGQHTLTAVATDSSNNRATSAAVGITVGNTTSTTPPTVPTGLTANAVSSSVVNLSWTASTDNLGVSGYDVFRNGTQIGTSGGTTYQDLGLTASTTYSYTVAAFDTVGNLSAQSTPTNVTTPASGSAGANLSTTPGWHKISYSELSGSENTSPCPPNDFAGYDYNYASGCSAVYNAWSGAAMDTNRHRLMIWGGGHTDYAGNEVYALDLTLVGTCTSLAPCLYRLDNPSPPNSTTNCVETLSDGRPNSRHTYNGETYDPIADAFVVAGGSLNDCGNGSGEAWALAVSSVAGSCAPVVTNSCGSTWTETAVAPSGTGGSAEMVWDSGNSRSQLITPGVSTAAINGYSASTNTWTSENQNLGSMASYYGTDAYDPLDLIVIHAGGGASSKVMYVSVAPGSSFAQVNVTTDSTSCGGYFGTGYEYPPMVFDPIAHALRVIPSGSNVQYLLHPSLSSTTWYCTTETYGSTEGTDYPPAVSGNGIFGRYNYDPTVDVFVYCPDPTQDCWYLRPNR